MTPVSSTVSCKKPATNVDGPAFKVARVSSGDWFTRLQPLKDVPNPSFISLEKYHKDYTVSIGDDILWVDDELVRNANKLMNSIAEKYKTAKEEAEAQENNNKSESDNA